MRPRLINTNVPRLGLAADVAELVTWLSSDTAPFVPAPITRLNGGYLAP